MLLGVRYRSGALSAEVDSVYLEWRLSRLLGRKIHIDRLHVTGFRVTLPDSAPPDTAGTRRARREKPNTPLPVTLGEVWIRRFEMDVPGGVMLRNGELDLDGTLEEYRFTVRGTGVLPRVDTTTVVLHGIGNLEMVRLDSTSRARALAGVLRTEGDLRWWPGIRWDLRISGDSLQPSRALENPQLFGGRIGLTATTAGVIDSSGPSGRVTVDSIGGQIRGRPVGGRLDARFAGRAIDHAEADLTWGSARLRADGALADTVAVNYDLHIARLATLTPKARGSLSVKGDAGGPRLTPRLRARFAGTDLAYGDSRIRRVSGRADFDLRTGGRTDLTLIGDSAVAGGTLMDSIAVELDGTRNRHSLVLDATGPSDTVRVALTGGMPGQTWSGRVGEITVRTAYSDWALERPTVVSFSRVSARVDSLCVVGDSAAGQICATGTWKRPDRLNAVVLVENLSLERLPFSEPRAGFLGLVSARFEARSTTALEATLSARLDDAEGKEAATLEARATLPGWSADRPLNRQTMQLTVTGGAPDLAPFRSFFPRLDSLRGAVTLEAALAGIVTAPSIDGTLRLENGVAGLTGSRVAQGSVAVTADLDVARDRSVSGEVRVTQNGLTVDYRKGRGMGRLSLDSGVVTVRSGADGVHGGFALAVRTESLDSVAALSGELHLPRYTRLGQPLAPEPVELRLSVDADLTAFQPLALSVDSLRGTMDADLAVSGTVGMPDVKGTLIVNNVLALLPFGTRVEGGVTGNLDVTVRRDSTVNGTLRVVPNEVRFASFGGRAGGTVALRESGLDVRAGPDGVRGELNVELVSETGASLGTLRGNAGVPGYTRIGRPIGREPIQGRLEGRIADLGFLPTFTSLVDSAAGRITLDASLDGTLGEANLVGMVEVREAAAKLATLGTLVEEVNFTARGNREGVIVVDGRMKSGGGELTIEGLTPVRPTRENPGRILVRGTSFQVANNAEVRAFVTPAFDVTLVEDTIALRGAVDVPIARIQLSEVPLLAVAPSDDVILTDAEARGRRDRPLITQVRVTLGDSVTFRGFNFDAKLGGSVHVNAAPDRLTTATGSLVIIEGHYRAYGQDLAIEDGMVRFAGGPANNPSLAIRAIRYASDSTIAGIAMAGTLKEPSVTLFSRPPMSQSQVLSYLVTGHPVGGSASSSFVGKALSALGLQGGNILAGAVGKEVGLSTATIGAESDLEEASLVMGRYLSPNLYISYGIGLFDPVSTLRLRYLLSRRWTLQAETGRETSADAFVRLGRKRR